LLLPILKSKLPSSKAQDSNRIANLVALKSAHLKHTSLEVKSSRLKLAQRSATSLSLDSKLSKKAKNKKKAMRESVPKLNVAAEVNSIKTVKAVQLEEEVIKALMLIKVISHHFDDTNEFEKEG